MKKSILFLAALAMIAASCSQKDDLAVTNTDPNAISFSAYTSTAVTRGVVVNGTDIYGANKPGIGVFAFYQPAVRGEKVLFNSRKYATPDFMYNQSVTSTDGSTWTYSPIKFWPNNTNDMVSFFAYAPYDKSKTWEDLGITTDACASKLTATFPIYTEKTAMQDILWAEPELNNLKPSTTNGAVNNPVTFKFKHILSKVALYVGVEADSAKGKPGKWIDPNTNITIDKVEFTNLAASVVYTDSIDDEGNIKEMTTEKCVGSSAKQNIVLTNENKDFEDTTAVICDTIGTWKTIAMFRDLLAKESSNDAFLFLAPQEFEDEQIIITYTVATTASKAANSSSITNTITKPLKDVLVHADGKFESGKAYKLKFLIGMNSVKFAAEVGEWDEAIEDTIYVPANDSLPINVKAAQGATCTFSDMYVKDSILYITVHNSTDFNKLYCKASTGKQYFTDSTWINRTSADTATIAYDFKAPHDTTKCLYIGTKSIVPTINATDCSIVDTPTETNDTWIVVIQDDGTKTTLAVKGDETTLSKTTSEEVGKYSEVTVDDIHTITYYKKDDGEDYATITVTASN